MGELERILDNFLINMNNQSGLYAVYVLDIKNKNSAIKVINSKNFSNNRVYDTLKQVLGLIKTNDFERLVIENSERYFIKRISENIFLLVVGDKKEPLGRTFAIASSLKLS